MCVHEAECKDDGMGWDASCWPPDPTPKVFIGAWAWDQDTRLMKKEMIGWDQDVWGWPTAFYVQRKVVSS